LTAWPSGARLVAGTWEALMLKEFRDFLFRGNVIDLAVAFIIAAAFGAVIKSLVDNIITPLVGLLGIPDMSTWSFQVGSAQVMYGLFLQAIIYFIIVAAALFFFLIKPRNTFEARRQATEEATPTTKTCPFCATEIPIAATRCPNCTQPLPA
jgi:large conductance mechanosensitive channel